MTQTLQDKNSSHMVQIPSIDNLFLCPVRALRALLDSRPLPPIYPLIANNFPPYSQVIDTHVMDALKSVLATLNISPIGHWFNSSAVLGLHLHMTIRYPSKISWPMGYGAALQFGHISITPHKHLPSYRAPLFPSSLPTFSLAWWF